MKLESRLSTSTKAIDEENEHMKDLKRRRPFKGKGAIKNRKGKGVITYLVTVEAGEYWQQ